MASSIYEALKKDRQEIRIVTILPAAQHSAPIECTLRNASLKDNPPYTALSYTWGDPNVTASIIVNGVEAQVTTNLESALRHIRGDVDDTVLWVDAICIHQGDTLERNHQVQLMQQIYSNVKVLVWLGAEGDGSDEAMELIKNWGPELEELLSGDSTIEDLDLFFDARSWRIIHCLFNRPWWTRIWTVQELALGTEVNVMCGLKTLSWMSFWKWLSTSLKLEKSKIWRSAGPDILHKWAMTSSHYLSSLTWKGGLRMKHHSSVSEDLLDLLWLFRDFQSSNPLDKVYALLGLAADSTDFMEPDYNYSISTVYSSVAHTLIQRDGNLDILEHSGGCSLDASDSFDLPSWVPNWGLSQETRPRFTLEKYCAARQTKAMVRFSLESSRILLVHGIRHGRISFVEQPGFLLPNKTHQMPLILRKWRLDDPKTYPSRIPRLQEFFRTLLFDCDTVARDRLSYDKEVFYDALAAFIFFWMQYDDYCDPSSHFGKWMHYINTRAKNGCLEASDFEPFIGNPNLKSEMKWSGEIDVTKRGALHLLGLAHGLADVNKSSFILTEKEYMGLVPSATIEEDVVCVLLGRQVPVILRPIEDYYIFIGDCFVYGLMDGQALQDFTEGKAFLEEFAIH